MTRAKALLVFPIMIMAAILAGGAGSSARPATGTPATRPAGPAASNPASQPSSRAATQPVDEKALADLVRLLGDSSFKVREEATEKLIGMGPAAYLLIEAKLQDKTLDLESVGRIKTVLAQITPLYSVWPFDANEAARRQDETAKALGVPKELVLNLGNNVTLKLTLIPAGKFLMGSPETEKDRRKDEVQHEVTISKPFYTGISHVTQEQYEQVMGKNPSETKGAQNPVEIVSWDEAVEFCEKLSQKAGKTVSLPTEAQWEYAGRSGSDGRFCFGDDDNKLGEYAWYNENSESKPHPVCRRKPNAWGLYDMYGNVWQWCADGYGDYEKGAATDPTGAGSDAPRVLRGGSWLLTPRECRAANRGSRSPDGRSGQLGFRVVVGAAGVD